MSNAHIAALRTQLNQEQSRIIAALADLDRLEDTLSGVTPPPEEEHKDPLVETSTTSGLAATDRVLDAMSSFKSLKAISDELDMPIQKVRNAMASPRVRRSVSKKKNPDGTMSYKRKPVAAATATATRNEVGITEAVMETLKADTNDEGLRVINIVDKIRPIVSTSASNLSAAVGATLSNLQKKGKVHKVSQGRYRIVSES